MRALCLFAVSAAFAVTSSACAPRVSKRAPASPHPAYAWMVKTPELPTPVAEPIPLVEERQQQAPAPVQPVAKAEPQATQVAYVAKSAPAKAEPKQEEEETPAIDSSSSKEEPVVTSAASSPKSKSSFYSFSDSEVNALRKRNSSFRKIHDKLKVCASKSEREIQRREQIREDIIKLQNEEYRTPKQEKKLIELRLEERKLKNSRGQDSGECQKMESQLAEMLRSHYGTGEATGARH